LAKSKKQLKKLRKIKDLLYEYIEKSKPFLDIVGETIDGIKDSK
jgi:hypothetical protein